MKDDEETLFSCDGTTWIINKEFVLIEKDKSLQLLFCKFLKHFIIVIY